MLDQAFVFQCLARQEIGYFCGVPDSYLNGFCTYLEERFPDKNMICANEGNAVAVCAGKFFATGKIGLMYMQNSGMGNALNPLVSLADAGVFGVPMILLIGWRGEGDTEPHHPQHTRQGAITLPLLDLCGIPYTVLRDDQAHFEAALSEAVNTCRKTRAPYALVAPKGVMHEKKKAASVEGAEPMGRKEAMARVLDALSPDTVFLATTGRATRELYFLRKERGEDPARDFLNVGSMGHVSSVALGIARELPRRKVVAFDGDGAAIMHMGALAMAASYPAQNFLHLVLNNGVHESVGGQKSAGRAVDLTKIASGAGYKTPKDAVETEADLDLLLERFETEGGPLFGDVRIHRGQRETLLPLVMDHREMIDSFMNNLQGGQNAVPERKLV